jgi:hypothetical protein
MPAATLEALASEGSKTETAKPARARLQAMVRPKAPAPATVIRVLALSIGNQSENHSQPDLARKALSPPVSPQPQMKQSQGRTSVAASRQDHHHHTDHQDASEQDSCGLTLIKERKRRNST